MPHVLSILLLLLLAPLAQAATYYVNDDGAHTASCGASTPTLTLATIQAGLACLSAGDTLMLRSGTYPEALGAGNGVPVPGGTSEGTRITIKTYPGDSPAIWRSPPGTWGLYLVSTAEQYLTFDNLIFDGNGKAGKGVVVTGNVGPTGAHHIRFVNCEFRQNSDEVSVSHTHHNEWLGGSVHDNNTTDGLRHGMYFASEALDNVVDGLQVYNNQGYGIHMWNSESAGSDRNIFRNNRIYNNALCCGQDNILINSDSTLVVNNVVYGGGGGGINVGYASGASNAKIYNNTVYGTPGGRPGIWLAAGSGHDLRNNISYSNGGGDLSGAACTQNLCGTNPLFYDPSNADFRLQPSSPARDTGVNLSAQFTTDITGATRVTPWDMGAYDMAATPGGTLVPSQGTFFLDDTGTNTTDCEAAKGTVGAPSPNPFGTYSTAFACMLGGSTLYVRAGIYPPLATASTPLAGGTAVAPTTVRGYPGDTATLRATSGTTVLLLNQPTRDAFLVLQDLTLDCNSVAFAAGFAAYSAHDLRLENLDIHHCHFEGIYLDTTQNVVVQNTQVHDAIAATPPLLGLSQTTNTTVTGSTLSQSLGAGLASYGGNSGLVVEKTTIRNNAGKAILLSGDTNPKITNNLLYANTDAVHLQTGVSGAEAYYNTGWNNTTCMLFDAGVTGQATNNICWASATLTNNAGAGMVLTTNQCTGASGCTAGDPLFVSTTPGDAQFLRLGASSPARDTGTPIPSLTTDITGKNRPDGSGVDKGAYEEVPVPVPPPQVRLVPPYGTTHFLVP